MVSLVHFMFGAFMLKNQIRITYRRTRRRLEKLLGGYAAEVGMYSTYPFRKKHEPRIKFAIFTYQRTGSTLLIDLLNSHPQIDCDGEILLNQMYSPSKYVHYRTNLTLNTAYGFKLQISHLEYQRIQNPGLFVKNIHKSGFNLIKLVRRDLWRTAISLQYAISSQKFHFKNSHQESQLPNVRIEPQDLLDKFIWILNQNRLLDQITDDLPHLDLVYEDDLLNNERHQITIDRICDYIGVATAPAKSEYIRGTTGDPMNFITNNDEILDYVLNTEYGQYIES